MMNGLEPINADAYCNWLVNVFDPQRQGKEKRYYEIYREFYKEFELLLFFNSLPIPEVLMITERHRIAYSVFLLEWS